MRLVANEASHLWALRLLASQRELSSVVVDTTFPLLRAEVCFVVGVTYFFWFGGWIVRLLKPLKGPVAVIARSSVLSSTVIAGPKV